MPNDPIGQARENCRGRRDSDLSEAMVGRPSVEPRMESNRIPTVTPIRERAVAVGN